MDGGHIHRIGNLRQRIYPLAEQGFGVFDAHVIEIIDDGPSKRLLKGKR